MTTKYVFEFVEEQSDRHVLVRETRDEVVEHINNLAKDLAQDDKTYKNTLSEKRMTTT